jgi:(S)-sulfolactate dehydrogenase
VAEIVISEFMEQSAVDELAATYDVLFDPDLFERPDELRRRLAPARALIVRNRTEVRAAVLAAGTRLEAVGRLGVGLDNIDVEACAARGIKVLPASGANDVSVAEYVLAVMMILLRGAYGASAEVLSGAWPRERLIGHEIAGRRLGLVGFGSIARVVATRARALDMAVSAYDPYVRKGEPAWLGVRYCASLEQLLRAADVVSIHVPLLPATAGLIDAAALATMKASAILINAARGGIVDEAALAEALSAGRLAGAALDVFAEEPLSAEGARRFAGVPNLILTPHIAGRTVECDIRVSAVVAASVRRALAAADPPIA